MSLSKKLRFEIFERDGFQCQYCGKCPPDVTLEVDHIVPVSKGGEDLKENLRASCFNCNRGKGAKRLKEEAPNDMDSKRRVQEVLEMEKIAKALKKANKIRTELRAEVCSIICEATGYGECNKSSITSIIGVLEEFGPEKVIDWIEQSAMVVSAGETIFNQCDESDMIRYFFGIVKNQRKNL